MNKWAFWPLIGTHFVLQINKNTKQHAYKLFDSFTSNSGKRKQQSTNKLDKGKNGNFNDVP